MSGAPVWDWWWVRHAPVADAPPFCGWIDPPADLSDTGAVAALAARLPEDARWRTSDLRRAVETAAALRPDAAPVHRPELREQHFGAWEGGAPADETQAFWRDPAHARPPDGESFADLCARVAPAIEREHADRPGARVVVAHAGVIRAALAHALGLAPDRALAFEIAPLSLTRIAWFGPPDAQGFGGGWAVRGVNLRPVAADRP